MIQDYLIGKLIEDVTLGKKIRSDKNISVKGKYALDATEKNPNIEGTIAKAISEQSSDIELLQNSVQSLVELPEGATKDDGEIALAKVGIKGERYNTLGDSIREQIKTYRDVKVSNIKPEDDEYPTVWIDTSNNKENVNLPEVKDNEISAVDTWSSSKINKEITTKVVEIPDNVVCFEITDDDDPLSDVVRADNILTEDGKTVEEKITNLSNDINVLNQGGLNLKEEFIGNQVNEWLDEHPEVTTTIQDGSIGESKLDEDLKKKINIDEKTILSFNNVDEMKNYPDPKVGQLFSTKGYYKIADGGESFYTVISINEGICEPIKKGLYAKLMGNVIEAQQIGCSNNGVFDNSDILNSAFQKLGSTKLHFQNGIFGISKPLDIRDCHQTLNITFDSCEIKALQPMENMLIIGETSTKTDLDWSGITLIGDCTFNMDGKCTNAITLRDRSFNVVLDGLHFIYPKNSEDTIIIKVGDGSGINLPYTAKNHKIRNINVFSNYRKDYLGSAIISHVNDTDCFYENININGMTNAIILRGGWNFINNIHIYRYDDISTQPTNTQGIGLISANNLVSNIYLDNVRIGVLATHETLIKGYNYFIPHKPLEKTECHCVNALNYIPIKIEGLNITGLIRDTDSNIIYRTIHYYNVNDVDFLESQISKNSVHINQYENNNSFAVYGDPAFSLKTGNGFNTISRRYIPSNPIEVGSYLIGWYKWGTGLSELNISINNEIFTKVKIKNTSIDINSPIITSEKLYTKSTTHNFILGFDIDNLVNYNMYKYVPVYLQLMQSESRLLVDIGFSSLGTTDFYTIAYPYLDDMEINLINANEMKKFITLNP